VLVSKTKFWRMDQPPLSHTQGPEVPALSIIHLFLTLWACPLQVGIIEALDLSYERTCASWTLTSPTPFWRPLVLCCVIQHLWFRPGFQLEILTLFYDVENKIRVFIPLRICFEVKMEYDYSVYWNYETSKASMALSQTWERFKCKGPCALDYV
jgi:hypothetical protein